MSGPGSRLKRGALSVYRRLPFRRQLALVARPLPIPWRLKRLLRFDGVVTVRIDAQHSFRIHTLGAVENDLFWRGYGRGWEATSLRTWAQLAPQARTVIDIGGNVGVYSLAARALNPSARIVAFEPLERMHRRLSDNAALNRFEIQIERVAVSDRNGSADLYDTARDDFRGASLEKPDTDEARYVPQTVNVVRLDDFCRDNGIAAVDLVKLDIEGHEPAALAGMSGLLASSRPTLLIEVIGDHAATAVWAQLAPLGYEAYRIYERRGLVPASDLRAHEGADRNYLICQPGTLERHGLKPLVTAAP